MIRSLKAVAAISLLFAACSSTDDELAGETAADDAADGKSDSAVDGTYTYFEIWRDLRRCASPMCGGFYVKRLNRTSTVCNDGASRGNCYAPELDWSESNLGDALQGELVQAAERDATSDGAIAIVRGRFAAKSYTGFGNLGRFVVTEAWIAETDAVSDGVFVKAHDSGVRCIQAPCASVIEKALNTARWAHIHALEWSAGDFTDDQIETLSGELFQPHGVLLAGTRYSYKENNQWAKGRTATAAYRMLAEVEPCYVGGCSGQICSDQESAISTCEWRDEYSCYQTATCERQSGGECGWTETAELTACLGSH